MGIAAGNLPLLLWLVAFDNHPMPDTPQKGRMNPTLVFLIAIMVVPVVFFVGLFLLALVGEFEREVFRTSHIIDFFYSTGAVEVLTWLLRFLHLER